jgi:hypothetical protein
MKWAAAAAIVLTPAFAGLKSLGSLTWGLHPRLYANACFAGFLCKAAETQSLQRLTFNHSWQSLVK